MGEDVVQETVWIDDMLERHEADYAENYRETVSSDCVMTSF